MPLLLLSSGLLLFFSPQALQAAADAATLFASKVLPALFPMMVLNNIFASRPGSRPPSLKRDSLTAVAFSFAAGSPASAQRLQALIRQHALSPRARIALAGATGVMSPLFLTASLAKTAPSSRAPWLLLAAHWSGALLTGGLCWASLRPMPKSPKNTGEAHVRPQPSAFQPPAGGSAASLPAAVTGAAQALLSVCGSMMLFSIIASVCRATLALLCPRWTAEQQPLLAVLWALLEIGGGAFAVLEAFPVFPLPLLCALCGFGGLSLWLQNLLFLGNEIRPGCLLLLRGLHGALSYGLCILFLRLFPDGGTATFGAAPADYPPTSALAPFLPALLLLGLLAFFRPARP